MKRHLNFLLIITFTLITGLHLQAQMTHTIDFEPDGVGADWDWTVTENADNPPLEFVANPASGGINTSATVAKFTARQDGNPWALTLTDDDGEFTFDASNSTVSIMVHKPVISDVAIKFEGFSGSIEIPIPNTVTDQWEEIVYDFSGLIGNTYSRIVIIPDFAPRDEDHIVYLDNIEVPDGVVVPPPPEPEIAAPDPTIDEADVLSIYSDVYTDLEGTNFNPNWGQSTVVTVDYLVDGNNTLKYENLNFQGTNLGSTDGGVPQDISGYDYFHLDFWTPNSTTLNFFMIDQSPGEVFYSLPITAEEWVSVDIPLSYFSDGGEVLSDIHQFKVEGNGTVWFDNWYFYVEQPPTARVQVIHNSADAAAAEVDVWLDDTLLLDNFAFRTASPFVNAPAGVEFTIAIQGPDSTSPDNPIWSQNYTLEEDYTYILVAEGIVSTTGYDPNVPFDIAVFDMGREVANFPNNTDVMVHHGATDAPTVDVYETGVGAGEIVNDLMYSAFAGYIELETLDYVLEIRDDTGTNTVAAFEAPLATLELEGEALSVIASGFLTPENNSDGPAFGLYVALAAGGELVELPVIETDAGDDIVTNSTQLLGNYPNPFNPTTQIKFALSEAGPVSIEIFNIKGEKVRTLVNEIRPASQYTEIWNGKDDSDSSVASGVYFYKMKAGRYTSTKKMILMK